MLRTLYLAAFSFGHIIAFYFPWRVDWRVSLILTFCVLSYFYWQKKHAQNAFNIRAFSLLLVFFFISLGATHSLWRTQIALKEQWPIQLYPESTALTIRVIGLPEYNSEGKARFLAEATTANGQHYRLMLQDFMPRTWAIGSLWQIKARVRAPVATRNGVGFDKEAWALAQNIDGFASLSEKRVLLPEKTRHPLVFLNRWRESVSLRWQKTGFFSPQGQALMRALIVGDQSGLDERAWQTFRPLGINHLISISGLHITMFAFLVGALTRQVLQRLPFSTERPRLWISFLGWLFAAIYTLFSGADIPALRSLLMLSVFAWVWWQRGLADSWRTWWVAMTLVLLWQPMAVLSVGFWLSFGLLGAMMWALSERLNAHPSWLNKLILAIKAQWAASLCGAIATVFFFGSLPLFAPLVNAVAIPWFSWLLVPFGVLVSLLPMDAPIMMVADLAEHTMNIIYQLGERLPEIYFSHPNTLLFCLAILSCLIVLLPPSTRFKPLALVMLSAFLMNQTPTFSGSLKVTVFDVGQGLSVLLQTQKHAILFDAGGLDAKTNLLPNLRAMGIHQLDRLILSHHDNDHDGGYPALQALTIKQLWAGQPEFYRNAQNCHHAPTWQIDDLQFEWLHIPQAISAQDDNEHSCVLRVLNQETALLITGDLSQKGEAALLHQYGQTLASQILILGHHGSKNSNASAFINTVSPQYAIASSGFANRFKHPHPDVQNLLSAHNVALLRTDTQGKIQFTIHNNHIHFLPSLSRYWWQKKPFSFSGSLKK